MAHYMRSVLAAFVLMLAWPAAAEDPRTPIELPPDVKEDFLAEMRTHLANLDEVIAALAQGDFDQAARTAEVKMTLGHRRWEAMAEAGASDEEIAAAKEDFDPPRGRGMGMGPGQRRGMGAGMGGGLMGLGPGFGGYMPDDFRAMGLAFHEAAEEFAVAAREVGDPPTPEDYQAVLDQLWNITLNCRGCHDSFRIP